MSTLNRILYGIIVIGITIIASVIFVDIWVGINSEIKWKILASCLTCLFGAGVILTVSFLIQRTQSKINQRDREV